MSVGAGTKTKLQALAVGEPRLAIGVLEVTELVIKSPHNPSPTPEILEPLKGFFKWLLEQIAWILEGVFDALVRGVGWLVGVISDKIKPLFERAIKFAVGKLKAIRPLTPDKVYELLPDFFAGATSMVLLAYGFTFVLDFIPFTNVRIGAEIRRKISTIVGDEFISGVTMGLIVGVGIETPLRYMFQSLFQPRIPDEGAVMGMYFEGIIDADEYTRLMGYHGYSPEWAWKMLEEADREIRYFEARFLLRYLPDIDPKKIYTWLRAEGYDEEVATCIVNAGLKEILREEIMKALGEWDDHR